MKNEVDIIVIGGGVVGLSAAIAMQQDGFSVTLLDEATLSSEKKPISRIYAINKASCNLFKKLNAWKHINIENHAPYTNMHIWDASNKQFIAFDSRMIADNKLGYMLEESILKKALITEAQTIGVNLINNYKVTKVKENPDHILVADEKENLWQAKLLIIADGARSQLREMLGVEIISWPYSQQAIIANVTTEKTHKKTAYQVFQPNGPLAFLPMADEQQSSIVWSTSNEHANKLLQLSNTEFSEELTKVFFHTLGKISLSSKRHSFPLYMRHTKQYVGDRWLIMGDAAHTIHPLAGLGLNVGLDDLATWIEILQQSNSQIPTKKVLNSYQRKRKHSLWKVIALMQGLHILFTNNFLPITVLRGLGLNITNRIIPLKKLLIEYAAGTKPHTY